MSAYIQRVETLVPETGYAQQAIGEALIRELEAEGSTADTIRRLHAHSTIRKRHSVLEDLLPEASASPLLFGPSANGETPTSQQRNQRYREEAAHLFPRVAERLLGQAPACSPSAITHVITVSCTGWYAPGPDCEVIRALGLSADVERYHLGFMGCYAALPALKMAQAFCQMQADANVLVLCVELCTLHFRTATDLDALTSASLFADGAAGALVSNHPPKEGGGLRMDGFHSELVGDARSADAMAWTPGDHGYIMGLSPRLPALLRHHLPTWWEGLRTHVADTPPWDLSWAVHPGGPAILNAMEQALGLPSKALGPSRHILAEFGNMSSPTLLFVLNQFLTGQCETPSPGTLVGIAFGPGLTIESGVFRLV